MIWSCICRTKDVKISDWNQASRHGPEWNLSRMSKNMFLSMEGSPDRPTDLHRTFAEVSSGKNRFVFCCLIYSRVSYFRQLANSIYLTSCFEYLRRARSRNKRHSWLSGTVSWQMKTSRFHLEDGFISTIFCIKTLVFDLLYLELSCARFSFT